jgi:polyphosphate kinase
MKRTGTEAGKPAGNEGRLGAGKEGRPYTQNRELSWLRFNERVLEEADDPDVPLLERLKFVAIFTSNLDEFFMIRVGSLFDLSIVDPKNRDARSDMTPKEQLGAIYEATAPLYHKKTKVYNSIKEGVKHFGIYPLDFAELEKSEARFIRDYYTNEIEPILSPQIVDAHHPFPFIANKSLAILFLLKFKGRATLGVLPVPAALPDVVFLPGSELRYIRTEKILFELGEGLFKKYDLIEKNIVCITRNADISPEDEAYTEIGDFRSKMKKLLQKRRRLAVVRLEANYPMGKDFLAALQAEYKIEEHQTFVSDSALKMDYIFGLFPRLSPAQQHMLTYPPHKPALSSDLDPGQSILRQVKKKDVLLHYPYDSMDSFLALVREAASDPGVISIKITIYRLARQTRLVEYLCAAAENGKDVTVVLELRARFDEQNNIDWSEKLEDAGCKILFGLDACKVHSKMCLITVRERSGFTHITQVGTGNYNEKTAELYTDLSLMTANPVIGQDAVDFFKNLSIGNTEGKYAALMVAPDALKKQLLELMDEEIRKGEDGFLSIKINALTDMDLIDKLAEASRAGVRVLLIVRGICALLPGIPGETDRIEVRSIVGRFLEHSRIYVFGRGESQKIYISSADFMTRNTERRIEVACPILDSRLKEQINRMLDLLWQDNVKARVLQPDGTYARISSGKSPIDVQESFRAAGKPASGRTGAGGRAWSEKIKQFLGLAPAQDEARRF